jgi:hypothetical protein
MNRKWLMILCWIVLASLSAAAQDRLYPVVGNRDIPVILNTDRSAFVVEKSFRHKLTLGYPASDKIFDTDERSPVIMLWLRFQNTSQQRVLVDVGKFVSRDDQGKSYPALALEEITNRIMAAATEPTLGSKTVKNLSLGRAANKPTADQLKDDIVRYTFVSGEIAPGGIKDGLVYFDRPPQKNFTVSVTLGDLWSQPLMFSTSKQR